MDIAWDLKNKELLYMTLRNNFKTATVHIGFEAVLRINVVDIDLQNMKLEAYWQLEPMGYSTDPSSLHKFNSANQS